MSELRTGLGLQNDPDMVMRRAAAASAPTNGNVVPFPQQPVTAATSTANTAAMRAQTVSWWQQNAGVPQHVAEGIADQVNKESGFNPIDVGDSGTSVGLYQAHADRMASLQSRANWQNPAVQHAWALDQVTGGDQVATQHWNEIKSAPTRAEASRLWQQYFERPAGSAGADHEEHISEGRAEISRVGGQLSKVVEQLSKEGGRSEETWKRLRDATDKMTEYQGKLLELAQKPPSPEPRDIFSRLGSLATVVGILGGALTRSPLATSLEAGAAAMDAYNKNDLLTYNYQRENWKTQIGVIEKMATFQNEQVRNVLYDERMEQGEKMNRLHALLSALGHEEQAAQAQLGDERSIRNFERQLSASTNALRERQREFEIKFGGEGEGKPGKLGKPTTFEVPDPADPKKRTQVTLQQGSGGQWFTLDKKPFDLPKDARPLTASQMGARESIFSQRGITSGSDVRSDLKNITELPAFTTRGLLSGFASQPPVSMLDAAKKNLANMTLTDEASGAMTDQMVGVARALASLETGGVYVNQHLVDQYEKLAPQSGDSGLRVLRKLGIMRQNAENALEGMVHNPRMSDDQREYVKEIVGAVREAIPWTPHDVNQLEFSGTENQTILDFAKKQGLGASQALPTDLPSPEGHVEGSTASEGGKVVAVIRNGKWAAP